MRFGIGMEAPQTLSEIGRQFGISREPDSWRAELWMAIAGPIASLVLGILFLVLGTCRLRASCGVTY